jgi:excisionase family DNA binding protein
MTPARAVFPHLSARAGPESGSETVNSACATREPGVDGWKLRHLRVSLGLSQKELAAKLGLAQPTISGLERQRGCRPTFLDDLADKLSVPTADLLVSDGQPPQLLVTSAAELRAKHLAAAMEGKWFWLADEISVLVRVSVKTIYRLVDTGKVKGCRIGDQIRIPHAAACEFLGYTRAHLLGFGRARGGDHETRTGFPAELAG